MVKYILGIILLIVIYGLLETGVFIYKYTHRPQLEEYVHPEVTVGQGPILRYIAAGDSTAVGMGATSIENTYPQKILHELSKNHTVIYKNIGVVGAETDDLIQNQLSKIIDFNPDIITISIGANDATHLVSGEKIVENEKKIIQDITQKTHATVYLTDIANFSWSTILPGFYKIFLEYRDSITNEEIQKLEDDRVKIVDVHNFGWSQFPDKSLTNSPDGFHPNDIGYANWTSAFLDRIVH